MKKGNRIGVMGGTFDPPHLAHTIPVEIAAKEFDLDTVSFVPALIPPHKQSKEQTDPFHRMAMLALAVKPYPSFRISTLELMRRDVSFTVQTIKEIKKTLTEQDRLYFILGSDSFLELSFWYGPRELLQLCELIIINRGNGTDELKNNLAQLENNFQLDLQQKVHTASSRFLPFSSTQIREFLRSGKDVSGMLMPEVESYIHKHSLYRR